MSQEVSLVPLCEEHLSSLAEIEAACFSEPWPMEGLRMFLREENLGFVAMRDGRAVGYGAMICVLDEAEVGSIATLPELRGRGIGRALLRAMRQEAQQRGITRIFLEVRTSNDPARLLYLSEGFVPYGLRKNYYRNPTEDAILMAWEQSKENKENEE